MEDNIRRQRSLQDAFLNNVRKNKIMVVIFLTNGVRLQGIVTSFDNFSILLKKDSSFQLVYKHALSTIIPQGSFNMFCNDSPGNEDDACDCE